MLKTIFSFFIFFSLYSRTVFSDPSHLDQTSLTARVGLNSQSLFQKPKRQKNIKSFLIAEEDSIFDESDLIDIESGSEADLENEDDILEQEFNTIEEDESETNFDPKDFEEIETDTESEEDKITEGDSENEDFNELDYEIISDKPGYEILSDEELEKEFEREESDEGDFEDGDIEDLEDFENSQRQRKKGAKEEAVTTEEDKEVLEGIENIEEITDDTGLSKEEEAADDTDLSEEEEALDSNLLIDDEEDSEPIKETEGSITEEEEVSDEEDLSLEALPEEEESIKIQEQESSPEDSFESEELKEIDEDSSLNLITNIRYLTESDQIVIDSSEIPTYQERINEENNQLIIEIVQAKLAKNLNWPYILRDFQTDFGLLKADQKDSTTVRVIIQLKPSADIPSVSLEEDGRILIGEEKKRGSKHDLSEGLDLSSEILPNKTLKDLYFGNIDFVGDPISFHVIDADVRQALRFISEESGMNMVIDEAVKGSVTLKLEDVPWDQALYTIFKVNSLGYLRDGNIVTILPLKKIQEQTVQLKEISDRQKGLSPFETKIIPIMYGKAQDIEGKVKEFSTPAVKDLTQGGRIIVHEESNSLIVIDNAEATQKIEKLAKFLDYPSQQVMVESKIVEVTKNFARNFGLNWSLSGELPVRIGANGLLDFFQTAFSGFGADWSVRSKGESNSFNLNGLPFIGNVNATLSLGESDGTARVLNTTKILVKSGKSATIDKNTPIQVRSSQTENVQESVANEGTITTTFEKQDVKLSSSVTPTVTSSGSISMNLNVTLSNPGPGGEGGATVIQRTAQTEVIAKSGQTVVLSGIYQKTENQNGNGTPFLRSIPFLGFLFNSSDFNTAESEMLMFITPTLVED